MKRTTSIHFIEILVYSVVYNGIEEKKGEEEKL